MRLSHFIHMKPLCLPLPIPAWELLPEAVGGTAEGLGECRGPKGLRVQRCGTEESPGKLAALVM